MTTLGSFGLFLIVFGIPLTCTLASDRKKRPPEPPIIIHNVKPRKAPAKPAAVKPKPARPAPSPDTIKAMHIQADAERAIAEALQRRADREPDTVKRARIERQVANSWLRFNKILDQIDKLTS